MEGDIDEEGELLVEGEAEGADRLLGESVGCIVGAFIGVFVGMFVGDEEGCFDNTLIGDNVNAEAGESSSVEGDAVIPVNKSGGTDGGAEGVIDGMPEGTYDGEKEGNTLAYSVGIIDGYSTGFMIVVEGRTVGSKDAVDGAVVLPILLVDRFCGV